MRSTPRGSVIRIHGRSSWLIPAGVMIRSQTFSGGAGTRELTSNSAGRLRGI
jgi:hypothetical protein